MVISDLESLKYQDVPCYKEMHIFVCWLLDRLTKDRMKGVGEGATPSPTPFQVSRRFVTP